jgi:MscS family membrane protein
MVVRSAANKCAKNLLCCFVFLALSWIAIAAQVRPNQPAANKEGDKAPAQSETSKNDSADPLGRSTPHGTVFGFLHSTQTGKYQEATQYLQLSKNERAGKGDQLAHQLHDLMDNAFVGRVGVISDRPEGSEQYGVPQDHERIGVFRLHGNETDVDLVRVSNATDGGIWLFSSQTLAAVPGLYSQIEEGKLESALPRFLVAEQIFGIPLWRWIAFVLLIPISISLAWIAVGLLRAGLRLWLRWKSHPIVQDFYGAIAAPVRLILTVVFLGIGIALLEFSLLFRTYYWRVAGLIVAIGVAWLVFRLINRWAEHARSMARGTSGYRSVAIVLLGQRILKVVAVIVFVLVMFSILGFDMTTAIAGLGIGSLAIAFAAQKTLENLIGGISILSDQVIRVGDVCRLGDKVGTVEDISLRSTRIRTRECTELSVPNGQLANMNVENLSRIDTSLFKTTIELRRETTSEQLRSLLQQISALLTSHPKVDPDFARVRFVGFGESSLDIEIRCHITTGNLEEFFAAREELLLQIMDLVINAGVRLAVPARAIYTDQDQSLDRQQTAAVNDPSALYPRRQTSRNF